MTNYRKIQICAAFALAVANFGHAADVTDKWKAEFESPIGHLVYTYDLKADAGKVTGKAIRELDGQKTEIEVKDGKITGDEVSFVEPLEVQDQTINIEYKGKIVGDEIKLTRKVGDFATMEIVAKRMKTDGPAPASGASKKLALKVIKVDSEETSGENGSGTNAVDGNPSTFWHTQWESDSPPHPHEIILELSAPARIKGFTYLPRQDGEVNGSIKDYEFFVSNDGKEFGQPVKKGAFDDSKNKKAVSFDAKQARFVKLRALSEINGAPWTSVAELELIPE